MKFKKVNLQIAKAEIALNMYLSDLPVGVAYLLLKNKMQEIQPLFQQQAMLEQQNQKNQTKLDQQDDQNKQEGQE